ncbi:PQQ-binding-like beta-propeller repeat protein [Ideonella sp.]|uniref:outer membrane protein assembly factor BamB family protein n=1 Tax=Ideonella sp. TaxID=1929293 RepID=UPI002B497B4E|nr:PQQ-binding-like beta-propeller repeat protein [Ideonella sp.]HJV72021.1 PQQ-binding-like beta-propeller repeat protein [Ideonella sp.]
MKRPANPAHAARAATVLTVLLAAVLAAGLMVAWPPAAAQSTFRGDAAHSGVQPGEAPRRLPGVRWTFPTGDRVVSSPTWADGVVYVGSDDGNIYAIDAASGRQRWMHRTGGPVASSPAVAGGRVFVTSYDGRLHALDAATGALQWKFATEGERRFEAKGLHGMQPRTQTFADPFDVYLSSPVVADGLVIFGSGDGHVYAVDAATGTRRWAFETGDVVHASPAVADGRVFVGSWDGRLYALDVASGRELWRAQTGLDPLMANQQGFQSSPAVAEGIVYTGCRDANLYAFEARTGRELWRFPTGASWVISSPAVHDGRVYFATSDSSLVHAVDAATGKPVWQQQASAYMFASPSLAGSVLLQGVLNGSLQARDRSTGELLWDFQTEASRANPGWALTSDRRFNAPMLYVSGWHDAMAIGAARQSALGSFFSSPLVVGHTIYVGSADGRVYALE